MPFVINKVQYNLYTKKKDLNIELWRACTSGEIREDDREKIHEEML
jgi:hypothetical protein